MKIVQLFVSLSCVSAAVLPVMSRYSAVKFNQLMNQNGSDAVGNQPNCQLSLKFPAMPQFPDLTPLGRVLPISYCEAPKTNSSEKRPMDPAAKMALKERLLAHNKLYPVPAPFGDFEPSKNPSFNPKGFERLLRRKYYFEIYPAIKAGAIDLAYIPSDPKLLIEFLNGVLPEYFTKYLEAGTIEKMRQAGLIKNKDLVELSIKVLEFRDNDYDFANLLLDHVVVAMLNDIDSDDFDEADWQIEKYRLDWLYKDIPFHSVITCGLIPLTAEQEGTAKFLVRYNAIFADAPLRRWKLGNSSCTFCDFI